MLVMYTDASRVRVEELAFAPDGRSLAAGGHLGGRVLLWNAFADGARAEARALPGGGGLVQPVFTPDGSRLFAGNDKIYLVELRSGNTLQLPSPHWCGPFAVSPDGTRAVVTEYPRDGTGARVSCWAVPALTGPLWAFSLHTRWRCGPLFVPADPAHFVQLEWTNENGGQGWYGRWVTRALVDASVVATSDVIVEPPERVAVSSDGTWRVASNRNCIRRYPGVGRWTMVYGVESAGKKHFTGMAFHPSGKYLAATSNDETVKVYDTATWEVARTFTWNIGRMRSIAFSPDGALAAAGSDKGKVVVWDVDL